MPQGTSPLGLSKVDLTCKFSWDESQKVLHLEKDQGSTQWVGEVCLNNQF